MNPWGGPTMPGRFELPFAARLLVLCWGCRLATERARLLRVLIERAVDRWWNALDPEQWIPARWVTERVGSAAARG